MKRVLLFLVAAAAVLAGCRQSSLPTVEGRVVDATIHSVTVETSAGDSLSVSTLGTDPVLVPGVLSGDEVRIAYEQLPDGGRPRAVRLDITVPSAYRMLPGIWRDCSGPVEVGLVLAEDGSARGIGLGDLTLQDWTLDEENLVLTAVDPANPRLLRVLIYRIDVLTLEMLTLTALDEATEALTANGGASHLTFSRAE